MPTKYLDEAGLTYFWSKIKLYVDQNAGGGGGAGGIGDGIPVGTVIDFAGSTNPSGYLTCDGTAISRSTYSDLFAAIGTTWGSGDGSTTFNLPDLRGRTAIGSGTGTASDATAHSLGSSGGAETHTLTSAQSGVPGHVHSITTETYNVTTSATAGIGRTSAASGSGVTNLVQSSGGSLVRGSNSTGQNTTADASSAHNNMQPYATVKKIIKAVPDTPASGGIGLSTTTVSLGTTGWSNNSKTVNVTGVTSSNTVIISPAPADSDAWAEADIVCTAQGSGTLTFGCDTVPSTNLTANVLILTEEA